MLKGHFVDNLAANTGEPKENSMLNKALFTAFQNANLTNEQALAVFSKQFKGIFRSCGKYHHKLTECPDKKTDSDIARGNPGRFQGKYFKCGAWGHRPNFARRVLAKDMKSQIKQ